MEKLKALYEKLKATCTHAKRQAWSQKETIEKVSEIILAIAEEVKPTMVMGPINKFADQAFKNLFSMAEQIGAYSGTDKRLSLFFAHMRDYYSLMDLPELAEVFDVKPVIAEAEIVEPPNDGGKEVLEESESQKNEAQTLDEMTVKELKDLCKEKGLEGYSSLNKDELIAFLNEKGDKA